MNTQPEDEEYHGSFALDGSRHGRGTLVVAGGSIEYKGRFKNGMRDGRGTLFFHDDGAWLTGTWRNDELEGAAVYETEDGFRQEGFFVQGMLHGNVKEWLEGQLSFEGMYSENKRHGKGKAWFQDGGAIVGQWVDGELEGRCIYYYPNGASLRGLWHCNRMESATYYNEAGQVSENSFSYYFDPATSKTISNDSLVADLYEHSLVYVACSTVSSAGEGLFAKCDLPKGLVVSFYNGIRIAHRVMDRRKWEQNSNAISLDEDYAIDVPSPWDSLEYYCASLAHKCNHSIAKQNAAYDVYDHPRFGSIKCIRTVCEVKKGQELFVDYGYAPNSGPRWYRDCKNSG